MNRHDNHPTDPAAAGYCSSCGSIHALPQEPAVKYCRELMDYFAKFRTIAPDPEDRTSTELSTEYLFGKARGKMFGVLVCRTPSGQRKTLKAFSGQYNGRWQVPGWVGPLFDVKRFEAVNHAEEKKIKTLTANLRSVAPHSPEWLRLRKNRRHLSRQLMHEIFCLYQLTNFAGRSATLFEACCGPTSPPTGTGDCCAPKLLNHAALNNLTPVGLAEFYWGLENRSNTRAHGRFYPPCREKCRPILGFLLCGTGGG